MVTLEQLQRVSWSAEFHYTGRTECRIDVGPRGGVKTQVTRCRQNGALKTWKRDAGRFRLPIKTGFRECGEINQGNACFFHLASECPAGIN